MTVWRLCFRQFGRPTDAKLFGGRWNLSGTAVVHTSGTLPLAVLQLFVQSDTYGRTVRFVALPVHVR